MNRDWKAVGLVSGIVIGIVIVCILAYFQTVPSAPPAHTEVVVPLRGWRGYSNRGTYYNFGWGSTLFGEQGEDTNMFEVLISYSGNGYIIQYFSVTVGATYDVVSPNYWVIEIKVSEVHSDYIVLLVKPL